MLQLKKENKWNKFYLELNYYNLWIIMKEYNYVMF